MISKQLRWWPSWLPNALCSWGLSWFFNLPHLVANYPFPLSFPLCPQAAFLPSEVQFFLLTSPNCSGIWKCSFFLCTAEQLRSLVPQLPYSTVLFSQQLVRSNILILCITMQNWGETSPPDSNEPVVDLQVPFKFKKSSGWEIIHILDTWFTYNLSTWIILPLSTNLV